MKKFFLTQSLFDNRDKVFLEYDEHKAVVGKKAYEREMELHSLTQVFDIMIYEFRHSIDLKPKEGEVPYYEVDLPAELMKKNKSEVYSSHQYPFWQLKIRENKDNGNIIFYGKE